MTRRTMAAIVGLLLVLPGLASAQGTSCTNAPFIPPDGRLNGGPISTGSLYFRVPTTVGVTYSFEVADTTTARGAESTPLTLTVFANTACTELLAITDTKNVDPGVGVLNARVSWKATTSSSQILLTVPASTSLNATWTASDTSLHSATWSTNAAYETYYSFKNTTNTALTGTLTLYDPSGAVVGSPAILTAQPNATAATNTVAMVTPRNQTGTAVFTHNGPPGAFLAEAATANFSTTPAYIRVIKFESVREIR